MPPKHPSEHSNCRYTPDLPDIFIRWKHYAHPRSPQRRELTRCLRGEKMKLKGEKMKLPLLMLWSDEVNDLDLYYYSPQYTENTPSPSSSWLSGPWPRRPSSDSSSQQW